MCHPRTCVSTSELKDYGERHFTRHQFLGVFPADAEPPRTTSVIALANAQFGSSVGLDLISSTYLDHVTLDLPFDLI